MKVGEEGKKKFLLSERRLNMRIEKISEKLDFTQYISPPKVGKVSLRNEGEKYNILIPYFGHKFGFFGFRYFYSIFGFEILDSVFQKSMILKNGLKNMILRAYDFERIFISENFSKNRKSEISDFRIIESFEIQKSWNRYKSHISDNQLMSMRKISISLKSEYPKSLQYSLFFACIPTIPGKYTLCNYINSEKSVL